MKSDANWCEKRTALSELLHSYFRSIVCIKHGINKVLRVSKPLNNP